MVTGLRVERFQGGGVAARVDNFTNNLGAAAFTTPTRLGSSGLGGGGEKGMLYGWTGLQVGPGSVMSLGP